MEIIQSLQKDSISIFDYFSLVSEICALSNEGHFTLGDWQDSIHKCIPESKCPYLPVSVKLISNQLYVWEDYSHEQSLNRGDKIISINGKTTDDIIKELQKVTPSEGIPRYHIFYPESEIQNTLNRGVLPDYEIVYSFEEIANEIDLHLEKALSLIKTK